MSEVAFSSLVPADVYEWVKERGHPRYRADQVLRWFYRGGAESFAEMTDLPAALREQLQAEFRFSTVTPAHAISADGGRTRKYLFRLGDRELLESVCMHYPRSGASSERTTVCLSTQVGCAVRCPFCATGLAGLKRNMAGAEVIDQVLAVSREEVQRGRRVSHLVYMGMGEPLHNLDATLDSARRFCDPAGLGLGVRRVTISTSGVVPGIESLTAAGLGVNLAVSLHAPNDELRDQLVPLNRKWKIAAVLAAAGAYAARSGRRVSYEYVMLRGVNDSLELGDGLGKLLHGRLAHVNLIPYNPIPGDPYQATTPAHIEAFKRRIKSHGVECTVRDTRGRNIDAACGQLRAEAEAILSPT
jgi:23S rRNA (adenine2503-C2)-methyltransferase